MNPHNDAMSGPGRRIGWWCCLLGALLILTAVPTVASAAVAPPPEEAEEADDAGTDGVASTDDEDEQQADEAVDEADEEETDDAEEDAEAPEEADEPPDRQAAELSAEGDEGEDDEVEDPDTDPPAKASRDDPDLDREPPDDGEEPREGTETADDKKSLQADKKPGSARTGKPTAPAVRRPRTTKERMAEIRRLREKHTRERKQERERAKASPKTPPRRTPDRDRVGDMLKGATTAYPTTKPAGKEERGEGQDGRQPEVEFDLSELDLPAEERTYIFGIDGEYADLINAFSRMSGLGVLGEPPKGHVTLKSTEKMDFKAALNRIRLLLFKHPENYWMHHSDNLLEVIRVIELKRKLPLAEIFENVEVFAAADLDENDLVMLFYTPERGSVNDLTEVRDFLPDYVLSAPLDDPTRNTMTIFALVKDIEKFLDLVKLFENVGNQDPRKIKAIPVRYIAPSEAVQLLGQLMDLAGTGRPAPRTSSSKRGGSAVARGTRRGITVVADDAQQVLIVRALQSDIDEIERILPFIDVAPDTGFNPVIIPLKHVTTATIMEGLRPLLSASGAQPVPGRTPTKSKSKGRTRISSPSTVSDQEVTVVPEPRTNKLIVMGTDEGIARVRQIVALLDVESDNKPIVVKLEHADTATLAGKVLSAIESMRALSGERGSTLTVTPDQANNSLVLIGTPMDVELARGLIRDWDLPGSDPTLHKYRLQYAKPSEVAGMLSRLDTGRPAPPTRSKSKSKSKLPPRSTVGTAGKFIGDDVHGILYVNCTDTEWQQKYLPRIEELDLDARAPLATHTVPVHEADPQEVIDKISVVLSGRGEVPHMEAGKNRILVIGATDVQIEQIEVLAAEMILDTEDELDRRLFELKYAQPEQIRDAILTMLSPKQARTVRRSSGKGKKLLLPRPAAPSGEIRIVEIDGSLLVAAPAEKMEEIAELVARLDVDQSQDTEIRVYPFPPGVDVQEVASALSRLVGGSTTESRSRPVGKAGKRSRPASGAGAITVIPQPASGRILVSAPLEEFPRIEETIELLASERNVVESEYVFVPLKGRNADVIVPVVEPILRAKINELIDRGELPGIAPAGPKGKGQAAKSSVLTIQADPRNDRIIISGPRVIVAEAKALIDAIDREPDDIERVIRTVPLEKTEPEEMTATIGAMLTGQKRAPTKRQEGRGKRPGRPLAIQPGAESVLDVTVTAAPGGQAIVLMGPARDVEEVEGWIRDLDGTATGPGKIIKVYDLKGADAEQVADTLMAVVDTGGPIKKPKAKGGDDLFDDWDMDLNVTRTGKDLYISSDYFAGTMLVAATPVKMREVDDIIKLFVGDDETDPIVEPHVQTPYMTYELVSVDAYDAVYALENILKVLWFPADDKPQVDYIPFTNILVIKGKPDRFKDVEDLIKQHVDTGTGKASVVRSILTTAGTGMTAEDAARLLMVKLMSEGFEVEVAQLYPEKPAGTLEEIRPCILPAVAFEAVNAAALAAAEQMTQQEQEPDADAVLRDFADALQEQQDVGDAAEDEATGEEPSVEQPVTRATIRIRYDDKKGILVVEGAPTAIDGAEELIKEIKEEIKDLPALPDIRIFRLEHVDPVKAADVLDTMFNNKQLRAQQQQLLRMQQQQQRQQQQRQKQQQGKKGQEGRQQGQEPQQQQQQPQVQMPQMTVTAYPNSRDRTIIIRAATEAFPAIIDLLATIDKEPTVSLDYKIFTFQNSVAAEVEQQIKAMLKLDGRTSGRTQRRQGQQRGGAQPGDQGQFQMEMPGRTSMAVSSEEITITSNPTTNTLFVMAPKEAMELVERFIEDLKNLEKPEFVTRTHDLEHADATEVVSLLEKLFQAGGRKRGKGPDAGEGFDPTRVNAPTFLADPRTNSVIVRALEIDLPKIEPMIEQFDVEHDGGAVQTYVVTQTDADKVAKTLQQIFSGKAGRGKGASGAQAVNIVGDTGTGLIFVSAPPTVQAQIAERIEEMDRLGGENLEPTVIKVALGTPSEIAKKIDEALGGKGQRGSRVRIIGDDAGKQLLVFAPEAITAQIESLVSKLDQPPTELDVRIFQLHHAQAKEILQGLNQMVKTAMSQLRGSGVKVDLFSASADERSNSLVVMGGPMTFMLVEKVLKELDIPPRDQTAVVTLMFQLKNANAADLARNINNIYKGRREKGVDPPKAEANPASNTLLVRGTKAQVEEIQKNVIDPAEQMAVTTTTELRDKRIPLQYAKADEVAQTLTQFFNNKFKAIKDGKLKNIKAPELTVSITAEVNSNSLLVTASDTNLALIEELLPEIDNENVGTKSARTPEIYPLTYADPGAVVKVVNNGYRKSGKVAESDRVEAIAEWATRSVVVMASAENQEEIAALIEELDNKVATASEVRVLTVKHADPSAVNRSLNDIFARSTAGQRGQTIFISNPQGSDTLLIKASDEAFAEIQRVVEQLDVAEAEIGGQIEVIPLQYTDAGETLEILQEYLRKPGGRGGRGGELAGDMRISAATATNSLIISGDAEEIEHLSGIIAQIDVEIEDASTAPKIIKLRYAQASEIQPVLADLFAEQRRGGGRRGGATTMPPVIVADDGSNSLIVRASAMDFRQIQGLVDEMDSEENQLGNDFKIIALAPGMDAVALADDLDRLYGEMERNRQKGRGGAQPQRVAIVADSRTNSLILMGPRSKFDQIEMLARTLESQGPIGGRVSSVIRVNQRDPEEIKRLLEQLIEEKRSGSSTRRGGRRR